MAIGEAPIKVDPANVLIFKLPATINSGVDSKPIAFGGMGSRSIQNRFPDHFPIAMSVIEVE